MSSRGAILAAHDLAPNIAMLVRHSAQYAKFLAVSQVLVVRCGLIQGGRLLEACVKWMIIFLSSLHQFPKPRPRPTCHKSVATEAPSQA